MATSRTPFGVINGPSISIGRDINPRQEKVEKVGIKNHGNTCYMNSAIQALYACARDRLLNSQLNPNAKVALELQTVFQQLHSCQVKCIDAKEFLELALPTYMYMSSGEDCSNFLRYILSEIKEEFSDGSEGPNMIKELFEIHQTTTYKCNKCNKAEDVSEDLFDLVQPLPKEEIFDIFFTVKLENLLSYFDDANGFKTREAYCNICNAITTGGSRSRYQLPVNLIITIPRGTNEGFGSKRMIGLKYPEILVLQGKSYKLVSIISHQGISASGGHYMCYCKHTDGQWYSCDDSNVTRISKMKYEDSKFGRGCATMLFYEMSSNTPIPINNDNVMGNRCFDTVKKIGLHNHVNYCYMNSAIQALYTCVKQWLLNCLPNSNAKVTIELQTIFQKLHSPKAKYVDARAFAEVARPKWFDATTQQDCSDFLRYLLSTLNEEQTTGDEDKDKIKDLFEIHRITKYHCQKCDTAEDVNENLFDLLQPLPERGKNSDSSLKIKLEDCLFRKSGKEEAMQSYCPKCELETPMKYKSHYELPPNLIITIPRGTGEGVLNKRNIRVKYPDVLQLEKACYTLISVTSHLGQTAKAGHYITYCKEGDGEWYRYSDTIVTRVAKMEYEDSSNRNEYATLLVYQTKQHTRSIDLFPANLGDISNNEIAVEVDKAEEEIDIRLQNLAADVGIAWHQLAAFVLDISLPEYITKGLKNMDNDIESCYDVLKYWANQKKKHELQQSISSLESKVLYNKRLRSDAA